MASWPVRSERAASVARSTNAATSTTSMSRPERAAISYASIGDVPRNQSVRVIVADDHPLMLEAIIGRLTKSGELEVVGTAADADALVAAYEEHRPDVVLSDYSMPGPPVPYAIRAIVE